MFTQIKPSASRSLSITLSVVLIAAFIPNATPDTITEPTFRRPVRSFERVATFDVPGQVAEILASTPDGETLIYTDSTAEEIGFVTITEPRHPTSAGITLAPAGMEPPVLAKTLVRDLLVKDDYRLEKIGCAALTKSGELLVVNDNDGAGETRLLRLYGVISRHPS